jgi:hypothetical protein
VRHLGPAQSHTRPTQFQTVKFEATLFLLSTSASHPAHSHKYTPLSAIADAQPLSAIAETQHLTQTISTVFKLLDCLQAPYPIVSTRANLELLDALNLSSFQNAFDIATRIWENTRDSLRFDQSFA